jgi:hypothetical protein
MDKCGTCAHLEKWSIKWYCIKYKVFKDVLDDACVWYDVAKEVKE